MRSPQRVAIIGSTGSIGRQAVDVAVRFPEDVRVVALAAHSSADLVIEQASMLGVGKVSMVDEAAAARVAGALPDVEVVSGEDAALDLIASTDLVLNALVGAAGLRVAVASLKSGARLALANKESLVAGGHLVTDLASPGQLIPVDSEHSAIFQCLVGEPHDAVKRIWLTASGGPFRGRTRAALETVTVEEALDHPRWDMGPKITVDSATLMNKGLEVIEAERLFGVSYDDIRVVVHPQSAIHSMVEFADGSVKAHLGPTDMRIPIQYAFSYPDRWEPPLEPLDLTVLEDLTFEPADTDTFRCLSLAFEAGRAGGTMPAVLNAANEVAVDSFLNGDIPLASIDRIVAEVTGTHRAEPLASFEQVDRADSWARTTARELLARHLTD